MKNYILLFLIAAILTACNNSNSEWKLLIIDGSLEGWHIFQDDGSKRGWIVEDNTLVFNGVSDMESGDGDASLLSDKIYGNFEIQFDWKVIPGANSGFCGASVKMKSTNIHIKPGQKFKYWTLMFIKLQTLFLAEKLN